MYCLWLRGSGQMMGQGWQRVYQVVLVTEV